MRSMIWQGPDGQKYSIFLAREPYRSEQQSVVFCRQADGWAASTLIDAWRDLRDISNDELAELLLRAEEP